MSEPTDIDCEFLAALSALTPPLRAVAQRNGVPAEFFDLWPLVGVVRATIAGETYEPCEDGRQLFVTPAKIADPCSPEWHCPAEVPRIGDIVDLVAWHPRWDGWATRRGLATWLGSIPPQILSPEPVTIWRSPASWLRSGADGLVPLTQSPHELRSLLIGCRSLVAEDVQHGRELRRALRAPSAPLPDVLVRRPLELAA